jgi:hypothetical protein
MNILYKLLGRGSKKPDYSTATLRALWEIYSDQWPDNNTRCWKPTSFLPAQKSAIKRAAKLCYAEWPEPVDWTVYSAFFMEFTDLALHLPEEKYRAIENFRKCRILTFGEESKHDPLLHFTLSSTLAVSHTVEHCNQAIINVRDRLRRSQVWAPVGVDDEAIGVIRSILLESTVEFASLINEWQFFILSIGRDKYVPNR